jgi:predicted ATPase
MDRSTSFRFEDKMNFDFHVPPQEKIDTYAALVESERAELVRQLPEQELAYLFRHALVQDTVYSTLMKHQRRHLHALVGETLERQYSGQLDEIAARLAQDYAQAADNAKTFEYAARAGDAAARVFAYPEARSHYALALDALARLPNDEEHQRARIDIVLKRIGVSLRADGPAQTLNQLGEIEPLAHALAAREDAPRADRVNFARVRYWQGHAHLHQGDPRAAFQAMQQVIALAREADEPQLFAMSASIIGRTLVAKGEFRRAEPLLAEAIQALEESYDEHEWIMAMGMHGIAAAAQGDYRRGVAAGESALTHAREAANLTGMALAHMALSIIHIFGGMPALALVHTRAGLETAARSGDRLHTYAAYGFQGWAQLREGQCAQATSSLAQSAEIAQTLGGRLVFADWFTAARAEVALACGQVTESIALAQETARASEATESFFVAGLAYSVWAQALSAQNSNQDDVETHFATSLASFEKGGAHLEAARVRRTWGNRLKQCSEPERAREMYLRAVAQFELSGLERETAETRALLHSL